MIVAHPVSAVQQDRPALADYRRHVYGNCWFCAHGHDCAVRDELDYLADVEAFAKMREANRAAG